MQLDTVIITNNHWIMVVIEVLRGNNSNPESNPSMGSRSLVKGQEWRIDSYGEDIFYRRDSNPDHPNGEMTAWTHRPCYGDGQTYHENI